MVEVFVIMTTSPIPQWNFPCFIRYRKEKAELDTELSQLRSEMKMAEYERSRAQLLQEETTKNLKDCQMENEKLLKKLEVDIRYNFVPLIAYTVCLYLITPFKVLRLQICWFENTALYLLLTYLYACSIVIYFQWNGWREYINRIIFISSMLSIYAWFGVGRLMSECTQLLIHMILL